VRARLATVILGAAIPLAIGAALLARGSPASVRSAPLRPRPTPAPSAVVASPAPADFASLRDVFRFADGRAAVRPSGDGAIRDRRPTPAPDPAAAPAGPRLVGLVWRAGRLVAALSLDGEVALAAPGESVAGVTVLSIAEDGVRVRRADGSETLLVPAE